MRLRIDSEIRKLDLLYGNISAISDDELKAHLSKYFCVKISGFLENVIKARVENISVGTSPKAVSNYLQEDVKRVTNLSDVKLLRLLRKFNPDWESKFLEKVSTQQIESLNSIVSNRNSIAHGQQDNISYRIIGQYFRDIKDIAKILEEIMKK